MEITQGGIEISFEVTFDSPTLNVAMSVYDVTGLSPVLVQGPSAMTIVHANTYQGKFTPITGHNYVIFKAVYTDGTFTVLDTNYAAGSESISAQTATSINVVTALVLEATVQASAQLTATVTC